jgi:spermidine synthase
MQRPRAASRPTPAGLLAGLLAALLLVGSPAPGGARAAPKLIEQKNSLYNNIYIYRDGPLLSLTFGHNRRFYTETVYDTRNELVLPVTYTRYMTVGLAYAPSASRVLEIGFGGGRTAWYLHKHLPGLAITSVELDPAVYDMAIKYFGIRPSERFRIEVADGRNFLFRDKTRWDVVMIDAYRGPFVPFHLLTREFFELAKRRLAPGGVMVQNIEPTTMMFDSAIATIRDVFANVEAYDADGNIVVVAYDGPPRTQQALLARAAALQKAHGLLYPLAPMLEGRRIVDRPARAKVLTDDFAPVESLLAIERHNRKLEDISSEAGR